MRHLCSRRRLLKRSAPLLAALVAAGCGARTDLDGRRGEALPLEAPCRDDADCDDGIYCDGAETCEAGRCLSGQPRACDDGYECTIDRCSEAERRCLHELGTPDHDGDGQGSSACGGDDCDDGDPLIYAGAPEACNGRDDDCDGIVDWMGEPVPITAALGPEGSFAQDLIPAGEGWLVAWHHSGGEVESFELLTLSAEGEVLARSRPGEAVAEGELITPSLAPAGEAVGLAWNGWEPWSASSLIRLARVTADLGLEGRLGVSGRGQELLSPRLASGPGDELALVYRIGDFGSGPCQLAFARLEGLDEPEPVPVTAAEVDAFAPSLLWTGSAYGLAYLEGEEGEGFSVRFLRLSSEGEILSGPTELASTPWFPFSVTLVAQGGELIAAWSILEFVSAGQMRFARLTAEGAPLLTDEPLTSHSASSVRPALAAGPGGEPLALAWAFYPDGEILPSARAEIRFATIDDEGELQTSPYVLTPSLRRATHPSLQAAGDHFVVLFTGEDDDGRERLYFTRACP